MIGIGVVMDGGAERARPTVAALRAAGGGDLGIEVVPTATLVADRDLGRVDGLVVGPGSPYAGMGRVLEAIRLARERGVPLVGT